MAKRSIDWGFVAFMTGIAIFVCLLVLAGFIADEERWIPLNEDCVLHVDNDRRLSGSTETRQIYCASEEVR